MKLSCFYLSALAAVALATSHAGATTSIANSVTEQHTPDAISITGATRINPTTIELKLSDGKRFVMDFYGDNIFRLFRDDNGGIIRNPIANPPADILVKNPRKHTGDININDQDDKIIVSTPKLAVEWNKADATMSVTDRTTGKTVVSETSPVRFEKGKTVMTLAEKPNEYFYGGGVQNGRFSHKGRTIEQLDRRRSSFPNSLLLVNQRLRHYVSHFRQR